MYMSKYVSLENIRVHNLYVAIYYDFDKSLRIRAMLLVLKNY